ncbi:hypothetical protein ACFVYJ_11260 [Pontibacter sp. JAM-7]|uniref:hypothetical protein n=1 Tax=Pontibacter sp. JAM-7 TaxID=3366581 RepID=UPI003AF88C96
MKPVLMSLVFTSLLGSAMLVGAHQNHAAEPPQQNRDQQTRMMQMREHLGRAENIMGQIRDSKQPSEQPALMHQHMQHMRMGMDMMQRHGAMHEGGKDGSEPCPYMDQRMGMMETQMEMMQGMMQQMMEHQSIRDMPKHE